MHAYLRTFTQAHIRTWVHMRTAQVERQITAKQAHVEVLRVQNWITSPQRFAVSIERKRADRATTLQGPTYLDVPALSAKDYKLNVYRCARLLGPAGAAKCVRHVRMCLCVRT